MNVQNGSTVGLHSELLNTHVYTEALEDVEHPAWVSTTSFSESCGSCFSRLSSLKDNGSPEMLDARVVPDQFGKLNFRDRVSPFPFSEPSLHSEEVINDGMALQDTPIYNEDDVPYAVSGSLQSLSSSSKTVYASPRSNSERQFHCSLNKSHLSEKAKQRRGSLYRERAPSENALDFNNLSRTRESKLSHSLHDVSSIPSNGLKNPSHGSRGTRASLSALYSRNRSRDSGFIHSESQFSLNSSSHNYDHVESKVKRYIQNIKDADALRRKERAKSRTVLVDMRIPASEDNFREPQDGPELIHLVHKMKHDLVEKDRILFQLKEDYYNLLKKYAEAENKIDKLRFGWFENGSPSGQENISIQKSQPLNRSVLRQLKETPAEIDDSSLTSSMFLSHFDTAASPDSSFHIKEDGQKNCSYIGKGKKEVIVSAPLRPISSLYCTSVRLDRVVTPLTSKSSSSQVGASSTASSRGHFSTASNAKKKEELQNAGLPDVTIREGTTDTGIDSCCPFSTEGLHLPSKAEPIGHLPHEDPILRVQRWQKSLPNPSRPGAEFSPCSKSTSLNRTQIPDNSFELMHHQQHDKISVHVSKPKVASIGIQVNGSDATEFPSMSSAMSTPMVPCLNLGELSGCTEDLSGSVLYSECERKKSTSKQVSVSSTKLDSSSAPEYDCSLPSKSFSSNLEVSASAKHRCEGRCKVCGCNVKSEKKQFSSVRGAETNSQYLSGRKCQLSGKPQSSPEPGKERTRKSLSHLNGSELAKIISLVWRDQDHVVPASPEEEKSFQDAFKTLERKMSALKTSVNLQTFVSLLDVLMEKMPLKDCTCHNDRSVPSDIKGRENSSTSPGPDSSVIPLCSEVDCSLLQCLEEVDDFTHQVWAKTESFLEVLNASNCGASPKPK